MPHIAARAALTLALTTLALTGCRVESSKQGNGDNVKVATPFGGVQIKTDNAAVAEGIGLPIYPGATPIIKKKDDGKHDDNGAADINMSFGSFKLRVKAASYHSDDPQDKIVAFYRPALAKYGDIIQCDHDRPIGNPTHTSQGLTCDKDSKNNHISSTSSDSKIEFKAGSEQHQHIVEVDPDGAGTKIGLVVLDLPTHFSLGDNSSNDDDKQ